ncbi:MAG: cupin domain-containing protein [Flavobacteriales bacterium]|nr:cupin domain-containing protein [Flavobacteriales bacterium]
MIRGLFLLLCLLASWDAHAQWDLSDVLPPTEFENIHVEKLASDSLGTVFIIWVKSEVKSHLHQVHTESIYVLEGTGTMTVGDSTFTIHPGSFIFVPHETLHDVVVTSEAPLKVISIQSPEFKGKDRIFAGQLKRPDDY